MSNEIKPDGYCAWHPKHGWDHRTISCIGDYRVTNDEEAKEDALLSLTAINDKELKFPKEHWLRLGWQIKSVWLSDKPPVPKITFEAAGVVHKNLRRGIFKLKEALNNKQISGLLITEAEVASILLALGHFGEEEQHE